MIKVKVNNEYKDVVKIFCGGTLQKEIVKVWSREAQEYVYESSVEYTGTLPIAINANGDALLDYRIYGVSGGVGEPTENLIDASLSEQTIEIKPSTSYAVSRYIDTPGQSASDLRFGVYDENDVLLWSDYLGTWYGENIKVYDNAKYFKITIPNRYLNGVSLVEGARPAGLNTRYPYPENYIPYGYKLPMTIGDGNTSQTVPVYIGENQLDAGEYVSYGEQKMYKRTENLFDKIQYVANYISGKVIGDNGEEFTAEYNGYSTYAIPVAAGETYTLKGTTSKLIGNMNWLSRVYFLNGQKQFVRRSDPFFDDTSYSVYRFTVPNGITYIELQMCTKLTYDDVMLVKGSTAPGSYIPYGLTPTDPPVPLPEIPTIKGETVIDYDGDPKPSQMYVKYRR